MQRIEASNATFYSAPQTSAWFNDHYFAQYGNSMALPISALTLNWIPFQLDTQLATLLDYCKSLLYPRCASLHGALNILARSSPRGIRVPHRLGV